jgi:protein TonB
MSRTLEDGRPTSGAPTRLAVSFEKDAAAPTLTHPSWIRTPAAEELAAAFPQAAREAKISSGRGVVDCKVQVGGGFGDCVVASEEPAGLGFGAAALKLAPAFALSSWTEDGRPLDGARLQLPIRFVDETASTASPTKP